MNFDKYVNTKKYENVTNKEKRKVKEIEQRLLQSGELKEVIVKGLEAELKELNEEIQRKRTVNQEYREESVKVHNQFKEDLFEDLAISNNPKRDKLFRIAWDYGHSSGYHDVYSHASELVELID